MFSPNLQIAVGTSQKGFQQISFANSIATTKGGTHVDYISQQVVSKILTTCQKKVKSFYHPFVIHCTHIS